MGVDIHACAERRECNRWVGIAGLGPFEWPRVSKHCYAFLADVRNYWGLRPIAEPRGVPADVSAAVRDMYWDPQRPGKLADAWHSPSWLTLAELDEFAYDATFEDKAPTEVIDGQPYYTVGTQLMDAESGRFKSYRQFLGNDFFRELQRIKTVGAERVVFWFDG